MVPFLVATLPYVWMVISKKSHYPEDGGIAHQTWLIPRPLKRIKRYLLKGKVNDGT